MSTPKVISPMKNKNVTFGLDFASPLSDIKLSKKDKAALKNMTDEEKE